MTVVLASNPAVVEAPLPPIDARALSKRLAVPAALVALAVAVVLLGGGRVHAFVEGIRRGLGVSPGWAALGVALEVLSLAGYVALLSLVAGRATGRIGVRESAQITLAGAAATRLLPTAGVGGLGLTLWALGRAGLRTKAATRTLLVFLVLLYAAFLSAIAVSGALLAIGLVASKGPAELSAIAAAAALLAITLCLALALRGGAPAEEADAGAQRGLVRRARSAAGLMGGAVRDACRLLRSGDPRLAGALAYWTFDAAVLWAMLHAFGSSSLLPVVALAYFVGQVANTLPIPGSVTGGIAGILILFGVPAAVALPSVLAYRAISVWLPAPVAIACVPALRATVARWGRADAVPPERSELAPAPA
jgi:putative heme transporter